MAGGDFELVRRESRECLLAELRARRSQIEREIFARINDRRFDQRGSDDPEYVAGLRAAGDAALDYVFAGVEGWGGSLVLVPDAVLVQARRAARAGLGLETVLRRYIAGHAVLVDFVMQEAQSSARSGQGLVVREVLAILSVLVDRLSVAVSGAYVKERDRRASERPVSGPGRRVIGGVEPGEDGAVGVVVGEHLGGVWGGVDLSQRERILRAFVEVAVEHGLADTSIGLVLARAKVSSRTLYELFPEGLQACLLAVLDETGQRVLVLAAARLEQAASWQEGVREVLAVLLVFFDCEPAISRVCFVEALAGGEVVVQRREAAVTAFRELVVAYVENTSAYSVSPLMAESAIASVMSIVYTRLLRRDPGPLIELLGPLMGLLMAPLGASEEITSEETRLGEELARAIRAGAPGWQPTRHPPTPTEQTQPSPPALLANPGARRARECLLYIADRAQHAHNPSNIEIGRAIGIHNKGQISRLLSQLQQEGLLSKYKASNAAPNAWSLTQRGNTAAQTLTDPKPQITDTPHSFSHPDHSSDD